MGFLGIGDDNRMVIDVPARYAPILGLPKGSTKINIEVSKGKGEAKAKDDAARALVEYGIPYQAALSLIGEDYEILDDSKDPGWNDWRLEELSPEEVAEGRGRTGMPTGAGTPYLRDKTWSIGDQTIVGAGLGQEKAFDDRPGGTQEGLGAMGGIGGTVAADPYGKPGYYNVSRPAPGDSQSLEDVLAAMEAYVPPAPTDFPAFAAGLDQSGGLPSVVPPAVLPPVVPPAVLPPVVPPAVAPPAGTFQSGGAGEDASVWGAIGQAGGTGAIGVPRHPDLSQIQAGGTGTVVPPAVVPPAVTVDPATGTPILTSREMMDDQVLRRAGVRRALQNVFGQELGSGVGPLAGYLQRQAYPLSDAMTAGAYADMARGFAGDRDLALAGQGGTAQGPTQFDYGLPSMDIGRGDVGSAVGLPDTGLQAALADQAATGVGGAAAPAAGVAGMPGYSFEDYLRTTRDQPAGLGGAYGQALQDVSYLRGLGRDALPPVLQSAFNPGSAEATADVTNLLGAAQRGRYSGLVSSRFRQPTQQDLFADYFLSRQDAAKAGQTPQNFLNFAASRYGL